MHAQNHHKKMSSISISINISTCKGHSYTSIFFSTHTYLSPQTSNFSEAFPDPILSGVFHCSECAIRALIWFAIISWLLIISLKLLCVNSHPSCCTLSSWRADSFVVHLFISSTQCLLGNDSLIEWVFRRAETFSKRVILLYSQCHWSYLN